MATTRDRARLALLVLLIGLAVTARFAFSKKFALQQDHGIAACLFISSNTDEGLPIHEAVRRLRSPAQRDGRQLAREILRKLSVTRPRFHDVVGDYAGEVENSLIVVLPSDHEPHTLRRAAAWFGLEARQKAVLFFHRDPEGQAVLNILDLPVRLPYARILLDSHGLPDRSLMPTRHGSRVVLLSMPGREEERLLLLGLALQSGGRLRQIVGHAELLAGPTLQEARQRYEQVLAMD